MRILISGSNGMLGSAIKEVFKNDELILTDIESLDVRESKQVMSYADKKPELIIHLAALTDLEYCERNPGEAYYTNHVGTINMRNLSKSLNVDMVYISTAGVFDGKKDSYCDDDIPNPLNIYGKSKWCGEICFSDKLAHHYTFRASWMMGGGEKDKKFVNLIYKQIRAGKKEIYAINDVYGCPTYTYDLAMTIKNVIDNDAPYGFYNCAGEGRASRYDVAKTIVEFLHADVEVIGVKDGYFKEKFPCQRSKCEVLINRKLNELNLSKMRPWREALKEYIEKCYTL